MWPQNGSILASMYEWRASSLITNRDTFRIFEGEDFA